MRRKDREVKSFDEITGTEKIRFPHEIVNLTDYSLIK